MSNTKHYVWSSIGKFGTEGLSFVGNVLIARILMPDDYGLVAMLAIFINLAMNLSDAGFNDGLIRKKDCDKRDIGTVATYNIIVASALCLIMYFSAPIIARFLGRGELIDITRVLAFGLMLKAFTLSGFVQLNKSLQFKKISIIGISCSLISIGCTYVMALYGMGYWALVLQPISIAINNIILLMIVAKWRPYFCFDWKKYKEMFTFSSNLLISYLISNIGFNIYSFIIGRFYTSSDLGYYNQAHKMQTVPTQGINNIILTTSYPIIAKEEDPVKRDQLYRSLFMNFNFIFGIMVFALMSISDFVFLLILGEKWMPSSPLFQIFILIALTHPLIIINNNIVKIHGRSDIYRNLSFIRAGLQIAALAICASFSLKIIIIGQVVASFISASVDMYFCGRFIGFTIKKQYEIWVKNIIKPLIAYCTGLLFSNLSAPDSLQSSIICFITYSIIAIILYEITNDATYIGLKNKTINLLCKTNK